MRKSFRLGTFNGVPLDIHITFIFVLLFGLLEGWWRFRTPFGAFYGLFTLNLLFLSVLVHEFAHVQRALHHGLPVRRVLLFPLGGLTEMPANFSNARTELDVALAGPLANLALALICLGGGMVTLNIWPFSLTLVEIITTASIPTPAGLWLYLVVINLLLAVLNLLPVFPLDGGRVFRSLLTLAIPAHIATTATIWLGGLAALGLVGWGILGLDRSPLLSGITLFITAGVLILGASYESFHNNLRQRLEGLPLSVAFSGGTTWTVTPGDSLENLRQSPVFQRQPVIPVVSGLRLVGLLTLSDVNTALMQPGLNRVAHAMRTQFPRLQLNDSLWVTRQALLSTPLPQLPVLEGQVLHGLISRDDIERVITGNTAGQNSGNPPGIVPFK